MVLPRVPGFSRFPEFYSVVFGTFPGRRGARFHHFFPGLPRFPDLFPRFSRPGGIPRSRTFQVVPGMLFSSKYKLPNLFFRVARYVFNSKTSCQVCFSELPGMLILSSKYKLPRMLFRVAAYAFE